MTLISRFLDLCDQSHIYGRGNLGIEKCRWIAIGIFLKANRLFLMCNRILILLVFGIPMIAKADIYVSQSGDMIAKWSTHPHDATYSKTSIVDALNQAKLAKKEMEDLKSDNERILREAKIERDGILKEAREIKERIVAEAKDIAKSEGEKMIEAAKQTITSEKNAAMADIKSQIGTLSVNIAESILKQKLDNSEAQNELVQNYLNKSNLN